MNSMDLEGIVATDGNTAYVAGRTNSCKKIKTTAGAERERKRRPLLTHL